VGKCYFARGLQEWMPSDRGLSACYRSVDSLEFYRVLTVFRTAIVFLQLFERYRREPGPNLGCIGFDTIGRDLLDYAFDIARGRAE
jgi:hypothetical protein